MENLPKVLPNDDGIRPAGKPDECFYCHQRVGSEHLRSCVTLGKMVRIRMTVEYEVSKPFDWSPSDIEFHLNDSSWCANNAIDDLDDYFNSDDPKAPCMCGNAKFEFLEVTDPGPLITLRTDAA